MIEVSKRDYNYRMTQKKKKEDRMKYISKVKYKPSLPYIKTDNSGNEYITDGYQSKYKKYLKKQSNKSIRSYRGCLGEGSDYKKVYDLNWKWF